MKRDDRQPGSREVEPRKRKTTPSDLARKARRLHAEIERATDERHEAWADNQPFMSARKTYELDGLHADKRAMRRDIYRQAPDLEGRRVQRPQPRPGA